MAISENPEQTAPRSSLIWATLFASILKFVSNVKQLFAADDIFRDAFKGE